MNSQDVPRQLKWTEQPDCPRVGIGSSLTPDVNYDAKKTQQTWRRKDKIGHFDDAQENALR
jgi:hypothetical protein